MKSIIALAGAIGISALSMTRAGDIDEKAITGNEALAVLSGNDSHISKKAFQRIESQQAWRKTWLAHLGLKADTIYRPTLAIDFDRCLVIAVFGGSTTNSCGYRVESVSQDKDGMHLVFSEITYQTARAGGGEDHAAPYAFIVLPKFTKQVVLEQVTHTMTGKTTAPTEVARLDAPKK